MSLNPDKPGRVIGLACCGGDNCDFAFFTSHTNRSPCRPTEFRSSQEATQEECLASSNWFSCRCGEHDSFFVCE